MSNVCLKIYVIEKQRYNEQLLYEWLLDEARKMGIDGGSVFRSIAGYGRHRLHHDESFFELAGEMPIQVEFILEAQLADKFTTMLQHLNLNLFYVRYSVNVGYM